MERDGTHETPGYSGSSPRGELRAAWDSWSPSISRLLSRSSHHIIFLPYSLPITPSFCTPFSHSRHHISSFFTLTYQYPKGKYQSFQLSTLPGAIQRPLRGNISVGLPGKSLCARIVPLLSSTSGRFYGTLISQETDLPSPLFLPLNELLDPLTAG